VDTGASDHMYHHKELFSDLRALVRPSTVTLPNGKCVSVTYAGTILINHTLALHGVLYTPNFKYNLLSVSKLSNYYNCHVAFTPRYCLMQAPSMKRPQVLGELYAGLYLLKTSIAASTRSLDIIQSRSICNTSISDGNLWHARLGHLPFSKLQKLGLSFNHDCVDSIKQCLICSKARQHRLSFPHSQIYSTHIFELIILIFGDHTEFKPIMVTDTLLL